MTIPIAELVFRNPETPAIRAVKLNSLTSHVQAASAVALDPTIVALAAFNTNGLLTQIAADTFVGRTITGTANEITAANGSGVAGNPTLSLPTALTFTGKTITGGTYAAVESIAAIGQISTVAASNVVTIRMTDTQAPATGTTTGGKFEAYTTGKPTAVDQRIGVILFGATDSGSVLQASASIEAKSGENWGTLAGEGTYLSFGVTANGAFTRGEVMRINPGGIAVTGTITPTKDVNAAGGFRSTGVDATGWAGLGAEYYWTGAAAFLNAVNRTSGVYQPLKFNGVSIDFQVNAVSTITLDNTFGNFANDAAAAVGGVPVNGLYRNGSVMMFRVA